MIEAARAEPRKKARRFLMGAAKDTNACIMWPFRKTPTGYGYVTIAKRGYPAHRASLAIHVGPPPSDSMEAAHSCGNRGCVNPRHLRWASKRDNEADKISHGTLLRGEKKNQAVLRDEDIGAIRSLRGKEPQWKTAERFGVSRSLIGMVQQKKRWGHI